MHRTTKLLVGLLFATSLAASLAAQKGLYEDDKAGFRFKIPDKWTIVPVQIDEKWIVAKFLSNRTYETKSRDYTDYGEHKPLITVIWFSDEARKLRVDEEKKGDTTYIAKNVPFRDYKDYLKRNLSEGYYIDKESQDTEADVPCTKFQVKIEKGASMKRRLTTWVFRTTDGEFAVECEVLEDHYQKLEPQVLGALRSFRLIPRATDGSSGPVTGGAESSSGGLVADMWTKDREQWRKLSPSERQNRRKQVEEQRMALVVKDIPAGWTVKRTKRYLVLSHGDMKFTNRLVEAAEAYRLWLEESFEDVSDEYVMQGVIRVCADYDEARAYLKGSANYDSFNADNREVVSYQDKGEGNSGTGYGRLFAGLLDQYLYDKDSLLYSNLPMWLHSALYTYVSAAKAKHGKLILEPDDWENEVIRDAERSDGFMPMKEIMGVKGEDRDVKREFWAQAARLLRFIEGPGKKKAELKGFLVSYMKQTIKAAEELEAKDNGRYRNDAKTEEEEEKQAKDRSNYWKVRRTTIMGMIDKQLNWSDETWASLDKSFHDFMKK